MAAVIIMTDEGLSFEPASHTYSFDGNRIAGVTETIRPLAPDYERFPAYDARERGKLVHALTAVMDGKTDEWPIELSEERETELSGYCEAWRKFKVDSRAIIVPEFIEKQVYHPLYKYAGTIDRVVRFVGMLHVLDIKTGSFHPSHILQLAAYREALNAETIINVNWAMTVYLRANGTYTTRSFPPNVLQGALTTFLALRSIDEWNKEHGRFTPEPIEDDWVPLAEDAIFQL